MVRSIEIPEPVFECDIDSRWDSQENVDQFRCTILVGGKFVVFERTYTVEPLSMDEDSARDEFLAEFAERIKALLSGEAVRSA